MDNTYLEKNVIGGIALEVCRKLEKDLQNEFTGFDRVTVKVENYNLKIESNVQDEELNLLISLKKADKRVRFYLKMNSTLDLIFRRDIIERLTELFELETEDSMREKEAEFEEYGRIIFELTDINIINYK